MMKKSVSKLWQGTKVSVRDYEVKRAIKMGGMEIEHKGQKMLLTPTQLSELAPCSQVFKSKTGGKDYQLIDITFKPVSADPRQNNLI